MSVRKPHTSEIRAAPYLKKVECSGNQGRHFILICGGGGGSGGGGPGRGPGAEPLGGGQGAKPPEAPAFLAF